MSSLRTARAIFVSSALLGCDATIEPERRDIGATDASRDDAMGDVTASDTAHPATSPTWWQDVRPLISQHCAGCHSAGLVGPFALDTFADTRGKLAAIAAAVRTRTMPPWMPLAGCQEFRHARALTDAQIETLTQWANSGGPEGDPARPAAIAPVSRPSLEAPRRISLPSAYVPDFTALPTNADDYRCFVIEAPTTQTMYLTGYDLEPGVRAMVHHANLFAVPPASVAALNQSPNGYSCFGGAGLSSARTIGVWVPGTPPARYPERTGIEIVAGSALVVQMHYYRFDPRAAAPPPDRSTFLLELTATSPPRLGQLVGPGVSGFTVPARTRGHVVTGTWMTPSAGTLWGVLPHMHKLGRRIRVTLGDTCAVDVPSWDFHWQQAFFFDQPGGISVRAGMRSTVTCEYDNPRDVPVSAGEGSDQEMCGAPFYFTAE
ncbi:MAG: hypothetical protein Q8Q09_09450 [Deltaproteobacteria bacterium]|nr:hypothetical protein [Deltaproteobacteria bacterium]